MRFFFYAMLLSGIIFILLFLLGYVCFLYSFVRKKSEYPDKQKPIDTDKYKQYAEKMKNAIAEYDKAEKQVCVITAKDGIRLYGSFIESKKKTDKLIIAFHGYRASAKKDFSPTFRQLLDNGISLLLVDQRAHGRSEGKYVGFGVLESDDVVRWCYYATERFGQNTKIYLYGISMGAASVTMAAASRLPSTVKGIIADCGFSSPFEIVKHVLKNRKRIPPYPTAFFINIWTKLLAGYDLKELTAKDAISQSDLPFLLIHGAEDRYVPTEMSRIIYNARPQNTTLLIVKDAKHARSHLVNEEIYLRSIIEFVNSK